MKITDIRANQIFDSNGQPALLVEVFLSSQEIIQTTLPGALVDCEIKEAIRAINQEIKPVLLEEATHAIDSDSILIDLDGTKDRSNFGKGIMLLLSMAMYKAFARINGQSCFDYIASLGGYESVSLPIPFVSMLGGDGLAQNYFVIPYGAKSMKSALDATAELANTIDGSLQKYGLDNTIDENGACENIFKTPEESLSFLQKEFKAFQPDLFGIGIYVDASRFFNPDKNTYSFIKNNGTYKEVIEFYEKLVEKYGLLFIEDGFDNRDWEGWIHGNMALEKNCNLIANDVVRSKTDFIAKAIEYEIAGTISVDPYQIGTITETIQLIRLCQQYGMAVILNAENEETTESFYADLAVGCSVNYTKFGGLVGGERVSKYNRLLAIENILLESI